MAPRSIRHRSARNAKPEENKQRLINMPLDVLIEIFLFLEPLDLLRLSRTTKGFRAFLLSRNKCTALWKSVISNVDGFPACPDHISAPAYTHLAFIPVCHGCFGPCETVEWELRMRCCSNCWQDIMIPHPRSVYRHHSDLFDVNLPTTSTHPKLDFDTNFIRVTSDVFPAVCSRLDLKAAKSHKRPKEVPMDEFVARQNEFWESIRKVGHLGSSSRQVFKRRLPSARTTLSKLGHGEIKKQGYAAHVCEVSKKPRISIRNMLSKLGWTTTDMFRHSFSRLPEVQKPEPLTPTEWAKIQPRIVSWLEKTKEETIWKHHISICKSTILSIREELVKDPAVKVKPGPIDIAMLTVVRSMLESSVHSDFTLDDAKRKLSRVVPQVMRKWSSDAVEELESFAREQLNLSPLSKPSHLPSVIFRCKQCRERLVFDKALSHLHLYRENGKQNTSSDMSIHERLVTEYSSHPRDIGVLQIDVGVSRKVENLIKRMGKNPSRVMYAELCCSTVKVACSLCRLPTNMDFRAAFEHCLSAHLRRKETEMWTRIPARKTVETSNDE